MGPGGGVWWVGTWSEKEPSKCFSRKVMVDTFRKRREKIIPKLEKMCRRGENPSRIAIIKCQSERVLRCEGGCAKAMTKKDAPSNAGVPERKRLAKATQTCQQKGFVKEESSPEKQTPKRKLF